MFNEILIINFFFFFFFFILLCRSWGFVGILLVVEVLWILLYTLSLLFSTFLYDISFFFIAILILILSAVELVISLISFIIYYNTNNVIHLNSYRGNFNFFFYLKKKINKKNFFFKL